MSNTTDRLIAFARARFAEERAHALAAAGYNDGAQHDVSGPPGTWALLPDEQFLGPGHPAGAIAPRIGHANHPVLGEHIVRYHPARILAEIDAKSALLDDLFAERHLVVDGDCWYTCPAATEQRDGGENCDEDRRGAPCDCGLTERTERRLQILIAPYAHHPDYQEVWRP